MKRRDEEIQISRAAHNFNDEISVTEISQGQCWPRVGRDPIRKDRMPHSTSSSDCINLLLNAII